MYFKFHESIQKQHAVYKQRHLYIFAQKVRINSQGNSSSISPDLLIMVVKPLFASILIGLEATKIECSTASRQNPILKRIYLSSVEKGLRI